MTKQPGIVTREAFLASIPETPVIVAPCEAWVCGIGSDGRTCISLPTKKAQRHDAGPSAMTPLEAAARAALEADHLPTTRACGNGLPHA
jgi:hypothetical protein